MSGMITLARPYAKAIFEYALAEDKLTLWSQVLNDLALLVRDKEGARFLRNPNVTKTQQVELLQTSILKTPPSAIQENVNNLLELLARNKRIFLIPDIAFLFDQLRAENQKTMLVKVRSYSKLTTEQEKKLKETLTKRLKCEITLDIKIDSSLIGGAIIQTNNLVIDGSVKTQLDKLHSVMVT